MSSTGSGRRAPLWPVPWAALVFCGVANAAPPKIIRTLEGFNEGWRVGSLPALLAAVSSARLTVSDP